MLSEQLKTFLESLIKRELHWMHQDPTDDAFGVETDLYQLARRTENESISPVEMIRQIEHRYGTEWSDIPTTMRRLVEQHCSDLFAAAVGRGVTCDTKYGYIGTNNMTLDQLEHHLGELIKLNK